MKKRLVILRLLAGLVVSIMVLVSNISITLAYEKGDMREATDASRINPLYLNLGCPQFPRNSVI